MQASLCNLAGSMLILESTYSVGQMYCCSVQSLACLSVINHSTEELD